MARKHAATKPMRFAHTLLPEAETLVTVQVAPHAICHLVHQIDNDRRLQLDADENGVVRFHARPSKIAKPIEFTLECKQQRGATVRHTIALAPGIPSAAQVPHAVSGTRREPLTGDDLTLSSSELVRRGYPPRPDPAKHPARYARWHRRVTRPFTAVTPHLVEHPEVRFSKRPPALALPPKLASPTLPVPPPLLRSMFNANNNIWSGALLTSPAEQFFWIQADWYVPSVSTADFLPYSAVAQWIGLDSSGTDLYQAGNDCEVWFLPFFGDWTITSYWMWLELLPFAPWGIPNFPVSPGDRIGLDIFVADENGNTWFQNGANGGLTPADNSVWFMVYNDTQNYSFWGTYPTGPVSNGGFSSTGFTGTTAEFIMERPTDLNSGNPYPLANFGIAEMDSCWYGDALYGDRPFRLGANGSSPFDGSLTYINMQNSATGNQLAVPISFPDDNSPGGYRIIWIWVSPL